MFQSLYLRIFLNVLREEIECVGVHRVESTTAIGFLTSSFFSCTSVARRRKKVSLRMKIPFSVSLLYRGGGLLVEAEPTEKHFRYSARMQRGKVGLFWWKIYSRETATTLFSGYGQNTTHRYQVSPRVQTCSANVSQLPHTDNRCICFTILSSWTSRNSHCFTNHRFITYSDANITYR